MTLEKRETCQVIIASELQTNFNAGMLTSSLAGLREVIFNRHYEVVLPEIKEDKQDSSVAAGKEDLDDVDDEQDEEKSTLSFSGFSVLNSRFCWCILYKCCVETFYLKLPKYF